MYGIFIAFFWHRMATYGICPESSAVIFFLGPLLQKQFPIRIKYQYRKRSMQKSFFVYIEFLSISQDIIVFIHEYYIIFWIHIRGFYRVKMCEKGVSSGREILLFLWWQKVLICNDRFSSFLFKVKSGIFCYCSSFFACYFVL